LYINSLTTVWSSDALELTMQAVYTMAFYVFIFILTWSKMN